MVHDIWRTVCRSFSLEVLETHLKLLHEISFICHCSVDDRGDIHILLNRLIATYLEANPSQAEQLAGIVSGITMHESIWHVISPEPFCPHYSVQKLLQQALLSVVETPQSLDEISHCVLILSQFVLFVNDNCLLDPHLSSISQFLQKPTKLVNFKV